jgi:hypothetical protein
MYKSVFLERREHAGKEYSKESLLEGAAVNKTNKEKING